MNNIVLPFNKLHTLQDILDEQGILYEADRLPRVGLLKHQTAFLRSQATHTGLVGGFGSGKSKIGTVKTVELKKRYPGIDVAYYLPTYGLIKDIAFPNFEAHLKKLKMPYELNQGDKTFKTPLGNIILRSMDNPTTIVGYEVGYSLIDETDIMATDKMKDALVKIVARNRIRLPDKTANKIDMVSTPEGFGFMYEFFVKTKKRNRKLIRAKSKDNPFLPETYFETLADIYTEEQLLAYLDGQFVNLKAGMVYNKYNRERNRTDREVQDKDMLHIGLDFNITNMNAVVYVVENRKVYAVDELVGLYDTEAVIDEIRERYGKHRRVAVYPDASGKNKSTSSGISDYDLLKKAKFVIRSDDKNPFVRDRINAMNQSFCDNKGEIMHFVNDEKCPELASALEQIGYKNGAPDKTGGLDHITEASGYFISQRFRNKWMRATAR